MARAYTNVRQDVSGSIDLCIVLEVVKQPLLGRCHCGGLLIGGYMETERDREEGDMMVRHRVTTRSAIKSL